MKHLKPKTPASCSPRRSSMLPGIAPPQKPTSTCAASCAAFRLTCRPSTVVVGGMLLSGMSMIVVTPPAAAARVAVAKPSHSVRPGSLTCTWLSTRPGSSTSSSPRSMVSVPSSRDSSGSIATTTPSRTAMQRGTSPARVITLRPRNTRSKSAMSQLPCDACSAIPR